MKTPVIKVKKSRAVKRDDKFADLAFSLYRTKVDKDGNIIKFYIPKA